jgi:hypothetical protein
MQIPALYGILLLLTYLLHYAILIGGVSFILEKPTRTLGGLTIAADLLLLFGQTLTEGYFFFNNLPPYFWLVLPLSVPAVMAAIWTYTKLGGRRLLDQSFRKRYAKIFAVLFWTFLAGAWFKSIWGIH